MELLDLLCRKPYVILIAMLIVALTGFFVHLGLAYTSGFHTTTTQFVSVWNSAFLLVITAVSASILLRSPSLSRFSTKVLLGYLAVAGVTGVIIFLSYITSRETGGAMWGLLWTIYTLPVGVWLVLQIKQGDVHNEDEEDAVWKYKPHSGRRKCVTCCGLCMAWAALAFVTIFVVLLLYQSIGVTYDFHTYKPIGERIPLEAPNGGLYHIHIYCTGPTPAAGQPTYLTESGGGAPGMSFYGIQTKLSEVHGKRVCSYDRSGYGWSELGESPKSATRTVEDLMRTLEKKGEHGPYLLIGHSAGGQIIQQFAKAYINEISGLVLIDSYPNYLEIIAPAYGYSQKDINAIESRTRSLIDVCRAFTPLGIFRWIFQFPSYLPEDKRATMTALYNTNREWEAQWAEYTGMDDIQINDFTVGSLPVLVLPAGKTVNATTCEDVNQPEGSKGCQQAIAASALYLKSARAQANRLSTNSSVVICPKPCEHSMVWDENSGWVLTEILSLGF